MKKVLQIIDKYLADDLLDSSNPTNTLNQIRKEIEAFSQADYAEFTNERVREFEKALSEVAAGIGHDLLGTTTLTREDMQEIARYALREEKETK